IRADHTGLYKIAGGRVAKIHAGEYVTPVVSSDGRWALASTYAEGTGSRLVRVDLVSGKVHELDREVSNAIPVAFVPTMNRVLLRYPGSYHYEDEDDIASADGVWLDPATGRLTPASGELRPLIQQTFRKLQPTISGDAWAAIPDRAKNETVIGTYSSRTLKFTPRLTLPKIRFDSMKMWVDEAEGKAYFVYEGHLLSVPLAGNGETRTFRSP
ncbi:MAG TPA: hypothetical protein VJL58_08235, partial [Pyrinomonadaceae bacterium]|nr:hypothetical protein [Pyrinomonadaceae bacterium]